MKRLIGCYIAVFLSVLLAGCDEATVKEEAPKQEEGLIIGYSVRTLANPYYPEAIGGIKAFMASLEEEKIIFHAMEHFNSDDDQLLQIKELIARGGKDVVLIVDPNKVESVYAINALCQEEEIYWSTIWTMAEDLHPRDNPYYVCHQEVDNKEAGYEIAKALFESFPGRKGRVLAIEGNEGNKASDDRSAGLARALKEYKDIELYHIETAFWDPRKASGIVRAFLEEGERMDGIWVANDIMAMDVVQTLKDYDLAGGEIKVVGVDGIALDMVASGDMLATYSPKPMIQAGSAAAITYMAYSGALDTGAMSEEQMAFYTKGILVTKDNLHKYEKAMASEAFFDFETPFSVIHEGFNE